MIEMQNDIVDVVARDMIPYIVKIADKVVNDPEHKFSDDQLTVMKKAIDLVRNFDGEMSENSIGASVYSFWQYHFYLSLLHKFTSKGTWEQLKRSTEMNNEGEMITGKHWTNNRRI